MEDVNIVDIKFQGCGGFKVRLFILPIALTLSLITFQAAAAEDFVFVTYDVLFKEDFNDKIADYWSLSPGWYLVEDGNNIVLFGSEHNFAHPIIGKDWSDYAVRFRFKLIDGGFHFNFRHVGEIRYFIGVRKNVVYFEKQIGDDFFDLLELDIRLDKEWHTLEVAVNGTNIKVYFDNELIINYNDDELPIRMGGISFETLENSKAYFDDIIIEGSKIVQK